MHKIRADRIKKDNRCQEGKFLQLVEASESWTQRNPIALRKSRFQKSFKANQFKVECSYCDQSDHKSANCEKIKSVLDRRKILSEKKLCFNSTRTKHCAADCRSNEECLLCKCKQHTSVCKKRFDKTFEPTLASVKSSVIYPVAVIKVNGIKRSFPLWHSFWKLI